MSLNVSEIVVEKEVSEYSLTKGILSRYTGLPVRYVDKIKIRNNGFKPEDLLVAKQKGKFLKRCPGTPKYNCCDYYVLNLGIGCSTNCTYCFLHQYKNSPLIAHVNIDDAIEEVSQFCASRPNKIIRLGSGEFIDSLGFDEVADVHKILIPALSKIENLLFEVKTKSKNVDHLLSLEHRGRVVVSFSLNSIEMAGKEEPAAASVHERIQASKKCQEAGYKIGFHFDPLIHYSGWQEGYKQVVDLIFEHIEPHNIAWISLGALRFNPGLKPIIQQKFPDSRIVYGELIPGLDGKLRYFLPIRKKMFKTLVDYIRAHSKKVPVYLCMEKKTLAKEVGAIANFSIRN